MHDNSFGGLADHPLGDVLHSLKREFLNGGDISADGMSSTLPPAWPWCPAKRWSFLGGFGISVSAAPTTTVIKHGGARSSGAQSTHGRCAGRRDSATCRSAGRSVRRRVATDPPWSMTSCTDWRVVRCDTNELTIRCRPRRWCTRRIYDW